MSQSRLKRERGVVVRSRLPSSSLVFTVLVIGGALQACSAGSGDGIPDDTSSRDIVSDVAVSSLDHSERAGELVRQFERLRPEPAAVHSFTNALPVVNAGGHLQGVQCVSDGWIVSASSSEYAWLAHIRRGATAAPGRVVHIVRLDDKPMKHAGGFQVSGGLLAVGIEDNESRAASQVRVYSLPETGRLAAPAGIVQRRGARERATAGAVAIAPGTVGHLLVAGDWDSRHLDIYANESSPRGDFTLIASITAAELSRAGWIDETWHTYQNLNLFPAGSDAYYLIGTTARNREFGVVDLFELRRSEDGFGLRKLASRDVAAAHGASLLWGGGACFVAGRLSILATAKTLGSDNVIVEYSADVARED